MQCMYACNFVCMCVLVCMGMLLHCMHTACWETHLRSPATCVLARQSSKAHKVPMNKPLSLVRYNYAVACKMPTCASGKCHTQIYDSGGADTLDTNTAIVFFFFFWLCDACSLGGKWSGCITRAVSGEK
mmetsp:Transcript_31557/g.51197  ORF Transcript_31557/g.51197 Transcript_31557/m.51197 type:complete len:129 (+) Transcript_31557:1365-1751(+)